MSSSTLKFIIIGVMKCGTSATSTFLRQHSRLYDMGKWLKKELEPFLELESKKAQVSSWKGETYYFNRYYDRGVEFYDQFTRNYRYGQMLFEKTPTYYKNPKIPERIRQMNPDIKILFVVCDNIRRTISRYLHMREVQKKARIRSEIGATFDEFSVKEQFDLHPLKKIIIIEFDPVYSKLFKNQSYSLSKQLITYKPNYRTVQMIYQLKI